MLSVNDYMHLKLLYNQFSKMNEHIKDLISKNDWDSVNIAIQEKDSLLRKIVFFEKPRLKDIKENTELNKIRLHLIEIEKENIELAKTMREQLANELSSVKKKKKILSVYEPGIENTRSTFDAVSEN